MDAAKLPVMLGERLIEEAYYNDPIGHFTRVMANACCILEGLTNEEIAMEFQRSTSVLFKEALQKYNDIIKGQTNQSREDNSMKCGL
ncbi:MAG: hypothetical protein IIY06_01605 [Proteobacteria bacterium]|nr:hypothetical protein [Pseudomonadota bacterium]